MPVIEIPSTVSTGSVEIPDKVKEKDKSGKKTERDLKRSCKGALHIRPGIKIVTADELGYIKEKEPKLYKQIRVVALTNEERKEVKSATQAQPRKNEKPAEKSGSKLLDPLEKVIEKK